MWFIGRVSELGRWFKSRDDLKRAASPTCLGAPNLATGAVQVATDLAVLAPDLLQETGALPPVVWHVLVAEDHGLSRQVSGVFLQSMGHRVSFAVNGAEALAKVAGGGIDLVLMDIHMPVMDGLSCARSIRALPGLPAQVPMVALTSDIRDDLVHRARQAGMSTVLSKPLQKCQLQALFSTQGELVPGMPPAVP